MVVHESHPVTIELILPALVICTIVMGAGAVGFIGECKNLFLDDSGEISVTDLGCYLGGMRKV